MVPSLRRVQERPDISDISNIISARRYWGSNFWTGLCPKVTLYRSLFEVHVNYIGNMFHVWNFILCRRRKTHVGKNAFMRDIWIGVSLQSNQRCRLRDVFLQNVLANPQQKILLSRSSYFNKFAESKLTAQRVAVHPFHQVSGKIQDYELRKDGKSCRFQRADLGVGALRHHHAKPSYLI